MHLWTHVISRPPVGGSVVDPLFVYLNVAKTWQSKLLFERDDKSVDRTQESHRFCSAADPRRACTLTVPVHLVAHVGTTTRRDLGGTAVLGTICCSSHVDQTNFVLLLSHYSVRENSVVTSAVVPLIQSVIERIVYVVLGSIKLLFSRWKSRFPFRVVVYVF